MSKRKNRRFGISRRLGENLWGRAKDPVEVRNFPPGQHGKLGYKKLSDRGTQLKAKQRLKKYYGDITEGQFHRIYEEAVRRRGDTGENFIGLLESRLDAFVFRSNMVPTIFSARQFVNHKHVRVNGKVVNIPSYRLKAGDLVEVKESSRSLELVQVALASNERTVPDYIQLDPAKVSATYVRVPESKEVPYPVTMETHLVVEYYSR